MKRTSTLMFLLTPFCLFAQDGMPDTSFGNDGIVITDINNLDESVSGLAGDSNGRIILVGTTYDPNNGDSQKFQAAYLEDHDARIIQANQRVIMYNNFYDFEGGISVRLARFYSDGTLDPGFEFQPNYGEFGAHWMGLSQNGKIICAGNDIWYNGPLLNMVVLRYNNNPLGISDFENLGATVSPNPSNGIFRIEFKTPQNNLDYRVFDVLGNLVIEDIFSEMSEEIDLSRAQSGVYFLMVESTTLRLLKN